VNVACQYAPRLITLNLVIRQPNRNRKQHGRHYSRSTAYLRVIPQRCNKPADRKQAVGSLAA